MTNQPQDSGQPDRRVQPYYYRVYLITVWREPGPNEPEEGATYTTAAAAANGQPQWRFSLEDPRTGVRRGFVTSTELLIALLNGLGEADESTIRGTRGPDF